jgi:hypothetical protein
MPYALLSITGRERESPASGDATAARPLDCRVNLLAKGRAMATGTPRPALGDKELQKLLQLIKGADSVELKLTVPEQAQRSTVLALGLDPL